MTRLDEEALRALLARLGPSEDALVDYKVTFKMGGIRTLDGVKLVRHVAAMANSAKRRDAFIIHGVDKYGVVVGVPSRVVAAFDDQQVQDLVKEAIEPPPRLMAYTFECDGKQVIVLQVERSSQIYAIARECIAREGKSRKQLAQGQIYVRRGTTSVIARAAEIRQLVADSTEAEAVEHDLLVALGARRLLTQLVRFTLTGRLFWHVEENNCRWSTSPKEYRNEHDEFEKKGFYLFKWYWERESTAAPEVPRRLPCIVINESVSAETLIKVCPYPLDADSLVGQSPLYRLAYALSEAVADLCESKWTTPDHVPQGLVREIYERATRLREIEELMQQIEEEEWW